VKLPLIHILVCSEITGFLPDAADSLWPSNLISASPE
jgi:hypothetical protein